MTQAAKQTLTDFADELYLAYLRLHSAWGCPGRIPAEARAWTPPPTQALITAAAAHGFRDRVEDAARATAPTEKRGGLTYARAVRVLHEVVAGALRTAVHPGPVDVCGWAFDLAWSGDLWIIDAPRPASSPHHPTEGAGTEGAPARRARPPAPRDPRSLRRRPACPHSRRGSSAQRCIRGSRACACAHPPGRGGRVGGRGRSPARHRDRHRPTCARQAALGGSAEPSRPRANPLRPRAAART